MIQENHFETKLNRIILKDTGRKIFVQAFEDRLNETIKHRMLSRSVSYKHLIKLECYKLQKHLLGMEEYMPLKCGGNVYYSSYDVTQKRVGKMLKLFRRYLNWIQNSVFEGEISEVKLMELKQKAKDIKDEETDSLIIFKTRQEKWLDKEIIGKEKQNLDNFL